MDPNKKNNLPCILLVDDDRDWLSVMRGVLDASGTVCCVHELHDGQTAMDFLSRQGRYVDAPRPDIVFLDIEMPGPTGHQVLKTIKTSDTLCDIPVVMVTGLSCPEHKTRATTGGADGYVVKTSNSAGLLAEVTSVLERLLPGSFHFENCPPSDNQRLSVNLELRSKSPRILLVEDDPDQRELISEVLVTQLCDSGGAKVTAVGSARECLAQDLQGYDIILLDYKLPDMSGLTVLREILARADVPVVIVTGENVSETAAQAIRLGAEDYVVKLGDYLFALPVIVQKNIRQHEIKRENSQLQAELKLKNEQLEQLLAKQSQMAKTDHLTNLSNRRSYGELLDRYYGDAVRYGHDLTCCMCDLDQFKELNDELGHQTGDLALVLTADIIRASLRSSDVAIRYGGDEFLILLPHTSVTRGVDVSQRILNELSLRSRNLEGLARAVTMSIGVASLQADSPCDARALVSLADRALYEAKDMGKNRIAIVGDLGPDQNRKPA